MAATLPTAKQATNTKPNVRPIDDQLFVIRADAKKYTPGGIEIPDMAKERPAHGTVVAVGPGRLLPNGERASLQVKNGDKILFEKYAGTEIEIGEVEYVVLKEGQVMAVVGD